MDNKNRKIRQLASYLKTNPEDSFTKFALALELVKQNESTKARVLFESILRQDPEYLGVYYHLGKLYEQHGRIRDAKELFRRGIPIAEKQNNTRTKLELIDALENLNLELDNDITS